jgi:hypothetical protein
MPELLAVAALFSLGIGIFIGKFIKFGSEMEMPTK